MKSTGADEDQGDAGGTAEEQVRPTEVPATGGDAAITALAQMFQSFVHNQKEGDERQETEAAHREQSYKVLSHQVK